MDFFVLLGIIISVSFVAFRAYMSLIRVLTQTIEKISELEKKFNRLEDDIIS